MTAQVYDSRICELGEGPLWHPLREQLFWFDILGKRLLTREGNRAREWQFDELVSAAGWVDDQTLLIASETALVRFDLTTGASNVVVPLEAEDPATRSNDGRADPWGGFWIGTMGKQAEPGAGAIYRYLGGKVRRLHDGLTIPNSICFAPDRSVAYFADTPTRQIKRQSLDAQGWPVGPPSVFVDLRSEALNPDGSVTDAEGCLWNAQWGASRVARYSPEGAFLSAVSFAGEQISCPAFGGTDLATLFAASAREGMQDPGASDGLTFVSDAGASGWPEPQVLL